MAVNVGSKAPEFTLPVYHGGSGNTGTVSLVNLRGRYVVLYFYPKDDTPGCTTEACGFQDNMAALGRAEAIVIGVSRDDLASHTRFAQKYNLSFHLAADLDGKVTEAFGAWVEKNMYGKVVMGTDRSTFIIDPNGIVKAAWRKVNVAGHVAEVIETLNALKSGRPVAAAAAPAPAVKPAALTTKPVVAKTVVAAKPAAPAKAVAPTKPAAPAKQKPATKPSKPTAKKPAKPAPKAAAKKPTKKVAKPTKKPAIKKPVKKIVAKKTAKKIIRKPAKKAVAKKKR